MPITNSRLWNADAKIIPNAALRIVLSDSLLLTVPLLIQKRRFIPDK